MIEWYCVNRTWEDFQGSLPGARLGDVYIRSILVSRSQSCICCISKQVFLLWSLPCHFFISSFPSVPISNYQALSRRPPEFELNNGSSTQYWSNPLKSSVPNESGGQSWSFYSLRLCTCRESVNGWTSELLTTGMVRTLSKFHPVDPSNPALTLETQLANNFHRQ